MIWLRRNVFEVLDVLKFVGIILLVFMFIHFNTAVAHQAQETKAIAASTNKVVKSQGDILKAIKQVTIDTQLTAQQQTAIIICMLQVPVESRTTDLQAQCRSQATSTPGTPPRPSPSAVASPPSSSPTPGTSPQPAPKAPTSQPVAPQPSVKPSLIQQVINNVKGLL